MPVDLGLVIGLVGGVAGGVQGPGDLVVAEAGLAGGVGELAQVGGGVGFQGAVGGPEQAGVAVAFGLGGDPAGQMSDVVARGPGLPGHGGLALRLQQTGNRGPVQAAAAVSLFDELIGLAVDLGGRGQDVAACRAEVQMVRWQVAVALVGTGEVGVQAAAGSADVDGRAVQQAGGAEPTECRVPVPGRAVVVDVEDVGARGAGDDGQVPVRVTAEPVIDLFGVGGGVAVAMRGGGDLLPWEAGQDRPAGGSEGQGLAEGCIGHGLLHGEVLAGAGPRG
jgi:hypothetical protein